jgi:triacylglycerol esterase/lipase EstA (alpha/beta hydrolase family)
MKRRSMLHTAGMLAASSLLRPRGVLAQTRQPMRDVVVLVPGITGSVLQMDGKDLWALSGSAFFDALKSLGGNLDALRLTGDDESLDDLGDGITASRLINDLHIVPGLWKIDGYTAISKSLAQNYKLTKGENYIEFAYDWRRSNVVSARRLARESFGWLRRWRSSSGNADAKLIFLAHSMGGLVVRWFAECLEGWRDTRMLVSFGTPYRGSLNAVSFISNGLKKTFGPIELGLR